MSIKLRGARLPVFKGEKEVKHFDPFPFGQFDINWKAFGLKVLQMRDENGLSVRDAAALTNISAATFSRVERGLSVEPGHFFTLLQFIGVRLDLPAEFVISNEVRSR